MKKGIKYTILIITLVLAMGLLAGCAGAAGSGSNGEAGSGSGNAGSEVAEEPVTREVYAMDTYMTLSAYGENAEAALDESEKEIKRIDKMLSTGDPDSEISKLNKDKKAEVSEETFELIRRAKEIGKDTGVFDISVYPVMKAWGFDDQKYRVPEKSELKVLLEHVDADKIKLSDDGKTVTLTDSAMEIDLGGIAKGYTSDLVLDIMREHGVEHALVNLGGNVDVLGEKPDGSDWRVAIADPENEENYVGVVDTHDKAVITSGGYQRFFEQDGKRYFHIIDLSDGFPAENGLTSVTIVSDDGTLADALSTSLFIMGPEKAQEYWKAHKEDFDAVLVKDDGSVIVTEGIAESYVTDGEAPIVVK